MPLTAEQLAALMRLQGTAEQVQASARAVEGREHVRLGTIGEQLQVVIAEVARVLADDAALSEEFGRVVPAEEQIFWRDVEPRASALVGWLSGAVQAESLQMRIDAEAEAYAAARVREERRVGFQQQAAED